MLQTLHIRDLALIGAAEIHFDRGLNVLSGATGGGKSLVVTALKLLRGEPGSGGKGLAGLVRHGADELRIDGEFALDEGEQAAAGPGPQLSRVRPVLDAVRAVTGREPEGGVLVVTRCIDTRGRSKVRIDGQPATLQDLREICGHLLEIHGQGETRALMRSEIQAETLDAFGELGGLRHAFAARLAAARDARARLDEVVGGERERQARLEFLRFQLGELDGLGLERGELEAVEAEHQVLAHLDRLRDGLGTALAALQDADDSASDRLGCAGRALEALAAIDRELAPAAELVADARVQVTEAARIALSRLAALDLDPGRLGAVEERLGRIRRGLDRFGPGEDEFFARRAAFAAELADLEDAARTPEELEAAFRAALDDLAAAGRQLTRAREEAAARFVPVIERELSDLGMPHTRFRVALPEAAPAPAELLAVATAHGPGPVDFEVRINPGEPFRSMRETASGGETARIVLAIKKGLADRDRVPFVVFDEIDAEIGGRLGLEVGRKLREVSVNHQALIVTHLPQVAAFADAHFRVDKDVRQDRTWTRVVQLDEAARAAELAAMSAGDGADADALAEARRLVARVRGAGSDRGPQAAPDRGPQAAADCGPKGAAVRRPRSAAVRGGASRAEPLQVGGFSAAE
jgi:DNA repair protein RecN (Recombination protein N)